MNRVMTDIQVVNSANLHNIDSKHTALQAKTYRQLVKQQSIYYLASHLGFTSICA